MTGPVTALGRARSWLYVPAHRQDLVAKALEGPADAVVLDLEDAVPADDKDRAREAAVSTCADHPDRTVWIRVNGAATPWGGADARAVSGSAADGIRLPKAETPDAVACLADETGLPVHPQIESAIGLRATFALARCHPLVAGVSLGETDLAADLRVRDRAHLAWARSRVVAANRAAGRPSPVASVWTDLSDEAGLITDSRTARDAGFFGRSVVHPAQIGPVHRAFTPDAEEVERARTLLASVQHGGAAYLDARGRFVDAAVIAGARWVVDLADSLHNNGLDGSSVGREKP